MNYPIAYVDIGNANAFLPSVPGFSHFKRDNMHYVSFSHTRIHLRSSPGGGRAAFFPQRRGLTGQLDFFEVSSMALMPRNFSYINMSIN